MKIIILEKILFMIKRMCHRCNIAKDTKGEWDQMQGNSEIPEKGKTCSGLRDLK